MRAYVELASMAKPPGCLTGITLSKNAHVEGYVLAPEDYINYLRCNDHHYP